MNKKIPILITSLALIGISISAAAKADILIIANKNFSGSTIENNHAKKLWLGKTKKIPGIGKMRVVDQEEGSDIKEDFYDKVANKNSSQLKAYWTRIIFAGRSVPPRALSSDKKVIEIVRKNKDMLGYIDSASVTSDVKVLLTIK